MTVRHVGNHLTVPRSAKSDAAPPPVAREYDGGRTIDYGGDGSVVTRRAAGTSRGVREKALSLILPTGFPGTVSPDYLPYRGLTAAQKTLNSAAIFFNTKIVLSALGVAFPAPAVAAMAWTSREMIGSFGKLAGAQFARLVDQNPSRWAFLGKAVFQAGLLGEAALALVPGVFLPVAISSQAVKAAGDTLVAATEVNVQRHMARADNLGEVQAKNSNQDMIANLVGTGLAMGLQAGLAATGVGGAGLAAVYGALTVGTVAFSYLASRSLTMSSLDEQKAFELFAGYLSSGKMMTPLELKKATSPVEGLSGFYGHRITLGAGLDGLAERPESLKALSSLFADDNYLVYREKNRTMIALRPQAGKQDAAQALFLSCLLDRKLGLPAFADRVKEMGEEKAILDAIASSRTEIPADGRHLEELAKAGWNLEKMPILSHRRADWGDVDARR